MHDFGFQKRENLKAHANVKISDAFDWMGWIHFQPWPTRPRIFVTCNRGWKAWWVDLAHWQVNPDWWLWAHTSVGANKKTKNSWCHLMWPVLPSTVQKLAPSQDSKTMYGRSLFVCFFWKRKKKNLLKSSTLQIYNALGPRPTTHSSGPHRYSSWDQDSAIFLINYYWYYFNK